jgi:hypothetical protein
MAGKPTTARSAGENPRRMWNGGPLRQFSNTQAGGHYIRYSNRFLTGFAGSYVCDRCQRPSAGVYLSKPSKTRNEWLCGGCKPSKREGGACDVRPAQAPWFQVCWSS